MKVLLSWLKEFAPELEAAAGGSSGSAGRGAVATSSGDSPAQASAVGEKLADQLSDLGLSVEELTHLGAAFKDITVAQVLNLRPHPNADRIQLVDVADGSGQPRQVCCGAFNMSVGDLVPLASDGSVVAGGMEIKRRKIRGEWSEGMLCSPTELELPGSDDGILILPQGTPLGADLREALNLQDDILFDLEVNPNRPDAMSVAGVARDLAARLKVPFAIPEPKISEPRIHSGGPAPSSDLTQSGASGPPPVEIILHEPEFCGHFTVRMLVEVTPGISPPWLTRRLLALGMRPVNPLVDISNFVMLELGQPTHAFDFDLIPTAPDGHKILAVRMARKSEQLKTLDGTERTLRPADGVIVDCNDTALSLAGVMGGASTEISDSTKTALVEAAWWDPMTISRTSRRHGLRSEASARFERGVDPEIAELALLRFAELAEKIGVAQLAPGLTKTQGLLPTREKVTVRVDRVNDMLGLELDAEEIAGWLEPMGFENAADSPAATASSTASGSTATALEISIPTWRLDCETEIDIIEEVARAYGYSRIPKVVPLFDQIGGLSARQKLRHKVADFLVGLGLSEVISLPFLAPGDLEIAGEDSDPALRISNPLVMEESVLRTTLRPGMLKTAAYNQARRQFGVRIFELGHVFSKPLPLPEGAADAKAKADLPVETEYLAVLLADAEAKEAVKIWLKLCLSLGISDSAVQHSPQSGLHPTRSGALLANTGKYKPGHLGAVGEIDPEILSQLDMEPPIAWLELDLDRLLDIVQSQPQRGYQAPTRFPSSDVDLSFLVSADIPADDVRNALLAAGGAHLAAIELFDIFPGFKLVDGKQVWGDRARSLAFRLRFEAQDRTLTAAEVAELRQACITAAESLSEPDEGLNVELREG